MNEERNSTTFLVAAFEKPTEKLREILANEGKLKAAAEYHRVPMDWAKFCIETELGNRGLPSRK